jgi:hypothetical protein
LWRIIDSSLIVDAAFVGVLDPLMQVQASIQKASEARLGTSKGIHMRKRLTEIATMLGNG